MFLKNFNSKENYILSAILTFYFFLNFYQLNFQEWSGMMDHDFYILYNSLLISSGLEQEGRDHPALITFVLHGFIFKIVDIFQGSFSSNIFEILNSNKISETFQFYFEISRITNFFINLVLFLVFLRLLKILEINKKITFFVCVIFLSSSWYFLSFFATRSENLSLLFMLFSMLCIAKKEDLKIKNYFFSGIFFSLAMFTKIQIIFFTPFLIFFIGNILPNKDKVDMRFLNYEINTKYFFYSLILIILGYLIFQLKIQEFPRFERNKYFDVLIFFIGLVSISLYFFITSKFKNKLLKEKFILFSAVLNGFAFCFFLLVLLDILNIIPINDFIYLRISNPIHYLSEFALVFAEGSVNSKFVLELIFKIFKSYDQSFFELLLLIILIFLITKNYLMKKDINIFNIYFLFIIFLFITLMNGLRPSIYYHTYYTISYLILFSISLNTLNKKYFNFFSICAILIFLLNNYFLNPYLIPSNDRYVKIFDRESLILDVCNEFKYSLKSDHNDASLFYLNYYHKKFDNKSLVSLCKELKI